jgi:hypothetical protein
MRNPKFLSTSYVIRNEPEECLDSAEESREVLTLPDMIETKQGW